MNKNTILTKRYISRNLKSIQIIEQTIESNRGFNNATDLYNALPSDIQYTTFKKILAYLEESNKIAYDKNGAVFWIFAKNKSGLVDLEKNSISLN